MPCVAVLLAIISPRLALVVVAIFSDILSRAFDSWVLPLIGFFILPWTTLAYGVMWDVGTHKVTGFEWAVVVVAFLADIGIVGGARRSRRCRAPAGGRPSTSDLRRRPRGRPPSAWAAASRPRWP